MMLLAACAGTPVGGGDDDGGGGGGNPDDPPLPAGTAAVVEIHAMDIWGQPLPVANLDVSIDGERVDGLGFPVARVPLMEDALDLSISLSADYHHSVSLTASYDGSATLAAFTLNGAPDGRSGLAVARSLRNRNGDDAETIPYYSVYVGLAHQYFSAGGAPARYGNRVELLMDGEEAWTAVYGDLKAATDTIHASTWWWESDFELIRPESTHTTMSASERAANTVLRVFEDSPATKRVIVGQWLGQDGLVDWVTSDSELWAHGEADDGFEFMGQANQTSGVFWFEANAFTFGDRVRDTSVVGADISFDSEQPIDSVLPSREVNLNHWPIDIEVMHASYHQKFFVIDDEVAFIGGMNMRRVDWDTSDHEVFEPRRMLFDSTTGERQDVVDYESLPDTGPRKDYMVRIEGPAAHDAGEVFKGRWDTLRAEGAEYVENSSGFELSDTIPEAGTVQVQVTTTLPDPLWQHSIGESWWNAINSAEDYIYIEDQYFRMPMLNQLIVDRMNQVPSLRLIVITKPVSEWTDPGCAWTHASHQLFANNFPNRYQMLQLRAFDTQVTWGFDETDSHFPNMDVHSKMLIVDDVFMSVGSANKNNRGIVYEGEMNAAIVDRDWVRAARREILANILPSSAQVSDDVSVWFGQLADAANWNDYVYSNWDDEGWDLDLDGDPLPTMYSPEGFVYSLQFRTVDDCLIEDVGPDMT
jgi:phosphatidylserine/phosphatidylglycerophosphate/cardiolipin synthase-like enzyme